MTLRTFAALAATYILAWFGLPGDASAQSCWGRCDGASAAPGSICWCDSLCTTYGDCCSDHSSICLGSGNKGCDSDADCPSGHVCGVDNAQYFGRYKGSACWPAACQDLASECSMCGTESSPCGVCPQKRLCDPNVRVVDVRSWVLQAGSDSTGFDSDTERSRLEASPAAVAPVYKPLLPNTVLAQCQALTGKAVQLRHEGVSYADIDAACLAPMSSFQCESQMLAIASDSMDVVNSMNVRREPENNLNVTAHSYTSPTSPAVIVGLETPGEVGVPQNQTFVHEVAHALLAGTPLTNHIPNADPQCQRGGILNNLMCESNRGGALNAAQCSQLAQNTIVPELVMEGGTYGEYRIRSIAVDAAPPGDYTFTVTSPTAGMVTMYRDGVWVTEIPYWWQDKVTPTTSYHFQFGDYLAIDVYKAGTGSINLAAMPGSLFDGRRVVRVLRPGEEPIIPGRKYGSYVVTDIDLKGASLPFGEYTFHVADPTEGWVELKRYGVRVMFVSYPPHQTVSDTLTHTFSFPNYFDITVRNGLPGSQNLGLINYGIFDGERVLRITHP